MAPSHQGCDADVTFGSVIIHNSICLPPFQVSYKKSVSPFNAFILVFSLPLFVLPVIPTGLGLHVDPLCSLSFVSVWCRGERERVWEAEQVLHAGEPSPSASVIPASGELEPRLLRVSLYQRDRYGACLQNVFITSM